MLHIKLDRFQAIEFVHGKAVGRAHAGRHRVQRAEAHGLEAMRFGALDPLPGTLRAAYRLAVNEFNGLKSIQLNVEHVES